MSATSKAEGLGSIAWWGFSPAIDLIETYSGFFDSLSIGSLTVLLVGGSDSRHILQTVSNAFGDSNVAQNYFILDSALEVYARYMLQIYIAMEQEDRFSLQGWCFAYNLQFCLEKTELFLELFGNTMVREFTATYLRHVANEFIRITTSFEDSTKCLQFMNMMHLRFRERDVLESIFKFWREKDENIFNIFKCWDYRLRRHLGTRYDAIPNVFDWDCSITLHDRQADQIDSREYSWWRRRGVAFELRPADYTVSNRCLASGKPFRNSKGENTVYWGYWGDITCSPYLAFGITTSMYPELAKKVNGRRSYGATTISEVNVRSLLWRLGHGCKCPLKVAAPFCIDNSRDASKPEQGVNAPSDLSYDAAVSGPSLAVQDSGESTVISASEEEGTTSISVKFHLLASSYYSCVAILCMCNYYYILYVIFQYH
ncbi:dynein assembly factor 3, axonemal [Paragonimus westermani]|uniref:Dynein assembly factor 3, axonemal n=1 Tax=Paragonimus westermani TaxID=34504 RepID=A0A5J4NKB5_9TREM|nr:dynein assembly factor 3, axonemal [Paragonimus westermani]